MNADHLDQMVDHGEISPDAGAIYAVTEDAELTHNTAPTRFVEANGTRFAYRRFGKAMGTPIVLLQHFMGTSTTTTR